MSAPKTYTRWTQERKTRLTDLVTQGKRAPEIAAVLGCTPIAAWVQCRKQGLRLASSKRQLDGIGNGDIAFARRLYESRIKPRLKQEGECRVWTGSVMKSGGYGQIRARGDTYPVHRIALEAAIGRILGDNEEAAHACDNGPCAKPEHLFAASHADNMKDMIKKGRGVRQFVSEAQEQIAFGQWLSLNRVLWCHPANEGRHHVSYMVKRRKMGVQRGCPDILIFEPTVGGHIGVAVEMKAKHAPPSAVRPEQHAWLEALRERGWVAEVCRGADEAIALCRGHGIGREVNARAQPSPARAPRARPASPP